MKYLRPFPIIWERFKKLLKSLRRNERRFIFAAIAVFVISLTGLLYTQFFLHNTKPIVGGELVEGVVAQNVSVVDEQIRDLTHVGLLRFDETGKIMPAVADSYSISNDNKTYTFTINSKVDIDQIIAELRDTGIFTDTTKVEHKDNTIVVTLPNPYAPFLADLTDPLFSKGPYIITSQNSKHVDLTSNKDFVLGEPYIPKITVKIFTTEDQLQKAVEKASVSGVLDVSGSHKGFSNYTLSLQRNFVLFFNLNRDIWKNVDDRARLAHNETFGNKKTLTITTIDSPLTLQKVDELKKRFEPLNVTVEQRVFDSATLYDTVIPKRDYDALLIGVDLGRDPDPYPFWHSSQIEKGQNLSAFNNREADKLLEDGRLLTDPAERQKRYDAFQKIFDTQIPALILDKRTMPYLVSSKIKNVRVGFAITESDRFSNIWEWYIRTKKVR